MIGIRTGSTAGGRIAVFSLAALMAAGLMLAAGSAQADTTFTVNSTNDPGTGVCDATECTLREAITAANNTAGADTINFNIPDDPNSPGFEVKTIFLNSSPLTITEAVTIDGYTQSGASPNTLAQEGTNAVLKIQLRGALAPQAGLFIDASDSVVRGLVINRLAGAGILIRGTGNRVEGNFTGTDTTGTQDLGNRGAGVDMFSEAGNNVIGGSAPAARNLISGNDVNGVNLRGSGNKVEGNLIGTQKDGTSTLGNFQDGVFILAASNNTVGGTTSGAANTIAFNGGNGVRVAGDAQRNRILRNSIFSNLGLDNFNGGLGINLVGGADSSTGVTANDPGDTDVGPNGLQNKPGLTSATTSGSTTTIRGKLNSTPNTTFTVQLFSNRLGTDEGKKFIGQKSVTTGADGKATFTKAINPAVPAGQTITATATDPGGNTSEFSAPKTVVAQ